MAIGKIIITDDIESCIETLCDSHQNTRIFHKSDFKIDDAKDVLDESYISSNTEKLIIIAGSKFNIYAQNALLKILEEPPPNIAFVLITKSKNALLPTIKSRLIIDNQKSKPVIRHIGIDLENLSLQVISEFVKSLNLQNRDEVREMIERLLFKIKESGLKLEYSQIDYFSRAILQNEYYGNAKYIFLQLLLMIFEAKSLNNRKVISRRL